MCKWVFKQVTQVRHLSLSHQFWRRCLQKVQRLHGVQDTTEAQRGKDRPANNGVFFVSEDAPHALACTWPWADLPGGGQDQTVSWGQPQGHPSTDRRKQASSPGGREESCPQTHWPQMTRLLTYTLRSIGGGGVPSETRRQLSACFLDDIPCISSPRINLGHGYQLRTQSRLGWWGVGGTTPESIGRFLWLGYRVWTDYHSGSEWPWNRRLATPAEGSKVGPVLFTARPCLGALSTIRMTIRNDSPAPILQGGLPLWFSGKESAC